METEKFWTIKLNDVGKIGFAFGLGFFLAGLIMLGTFTGFMLNVCNLIK